MSTHGPSDETGGSSARPTGMPSDRGHEQRQRDEAKQIRIRREMVGLADVSPPEEKKEGHDDLVGLAFSGGGIRSASFNLGILQAIHQLGVLRHVDYLSTVSGGGYIGSFLSSLLMKSENAIKDDNDLLLRPEASGKQKQRVIEFIRGGKYLTRKPLEFTSFYLPGVILNNVVLFAGLFSICTIIALGWRFLDSESAIAWLGEYIPWLAADWVRPFIPCIVLFPVWIVARWYTIFLSGYEGVGRWHDALLFISLISAIVGAVLAAGNMQTQSTQWLQPYIDGARYIFSVALALGLLPVLTPLRLVKSAEEEEGKRETKLADKIFLQFCSFALLAGLPLAILYYVGRDNASARDQAIIVDDIVDWRILRNIKEDYPDEWGRVMARLGPLDYQSTVQRLLVFLAEDDERGPVTYEIIERRVPAELRVMILMASEDYLQPIVVAINIELIQNLDFARKIADSDSIDKSLTQLATMVRDGEATQRDIERLNRGYLEKRYGTMMRQVSGTSIGAVREADQWWRMKVIGISLAVSFLCLLFTDANVTSVHHYYANRLAQAYIEPVGLSGRKIPLDQLKNTVHGGPYHLINATVRIDGDSSDDAAEAFLFSRDYCGSERTGYRSTREYMGGQADLAKAMAISGGAVSPTVPKNLLVKTVMFMLNLRLGQWLPSPMSTRANDRATLGQVYLADKLRKRADRRFCFVSDGGHHENLGLEALLLRKCKIIFVCDAGFDPDYQFADLTKVIRKSREYWGIQFLDLRDGEPVRELADLIPDENKLTRQHYHALRIRYPVDMQSATSGQQDGTGSTTPQDWEKDPQEGLLVYVKPSFSGDEELDLLRYRAKHPRFPQQPTSNQLYEEEQFESYRQLGYHIGLSVFQGLDDDVDLWTQHVSGRIDAIARPFASPATRDLIQSRRIKKWDEWSTMNELLQQTDLPSTERACCATALAEYSRRSGETRRIIRNTLDEATKDDAEDVRVAAAAAWKAIEPLPVKPSSRRSKKQ